MKKILVFISDLFCKHDWKILSEITTKSRIEVMVEAGCIEIRNVFRAADRKYIQIITCVKCGKLKRFVEDI